MTNYFFKDKPIVGLDISSTGLKIMAIDPKRQLVLGYGSTDLDSAKVQESLDSEDNSYLSENLAALVKDKVLGSMPSNHVAISVPAGKTYSRTFTLPSDQEKNIADAVSVEVNQYIPIPDSALYIDYAVIERTEKEATVIMSAIPKVLVDNCISAAVNAGLRPVVVEPGVNSIARLLEISEKGHLVTVIVDIGPESTDIAIIDKGAVRISGSLAIGGNTFTIAISQTLDTTLENAHQLKVVNGLNPGPRREKILAAIDPHLKKVKNEISRVIRYYNERISDERNIEQIIIVGGGSDFPGVGEYFTNEMMIPSRVASPWNELDFGQLPQPNRQFRPRYITVAGVASVIPEEIFP